jgi:hypothetical protein
MDLFPHLATVTYLTGCSGGQAPTMVLDHTPHKSVCGENAAAEGETEKEESGGGDVDEEEEELANMSSPYETRSNGIRQAWLSSPLEGKHICFNGRMLHGGMTELADYFGARSEETINDDEKKKNKIGQPLNKKAKVEIKNSKAANDDDDDEEEDDDSSEDVPPRVTLLVNLWFNWKPLTASPLPDALKAKMKLTKHSVAFGNPSMQTCAELNTPALPNKPTSSSSSSSSKKRDDDDDDEDESSIIIRKFKQRGCSHYLKVPLPIKPPKQLLQGASAKLIFDPSNPARVECTLHDNEHCSDDDDDDSDDDDDDSDDDEDDSDSEDEDSDEDSEDDDEDHNDDWHKAKLIEFLIKSSVKTGHKAERALIASQKLQEKMSEENVAWCHQVASQSLNAANDDDDEEDEEEEDDDDEDGGSEEIEAADDDSGENAINEEFEVVD